MARANWAMASQFQARLPHTYTAMEHLIMAMADAHNNHGKTTFFGNDKGLKSYIKFEEKLKDVLIAMTMDGIASRAQSANEFREILQEVVHAWFEIFPNWPDAQTFSAEKIFINPNVGNQLIRALIGVK
jgi:hypothetical protein